MGIEGIFRCRLCRQQRDTYQRNGICSIFYECTSLLVLTWTEKCDALELKQNIWLALFILNLLRQLQEKLQLAIRVRVDNIGAIFLAENQNNSDRTKHVDTRYHFVQQYIRDGTVLIEFIHSCDIDSDIFTKNTTSEIHHQHSEKLIWTKDEYESEARQITTGRVLRSIVNQSSSMTNNTNTIKEMPNTYDMAIGNMKNNTTDILRGANQYRVLDDSDKDCMKIGTKCTT